MISITNNEKTVISSAKYNLLSVTTPKNSSCTDYLVLDENDILFQQSQSEKLILVEYKTDFDSSKYLCEGYGGKLTLPKKEEDMKTLGHLIQQSEVCEFPFLGLKKSCDENIVDLKGNVISYLQWAPNQPNGGEFQQCISTNSHSIINDLECQFKKCFFCQIPEKSRFILRGPLISDIERKYFVTMNMKYTEIQGITETECFWKEGKWNLGMNLKLDNATNNMPPVGLQNWNN